MATFGTINTTNTSSSDDEYLIRQGGVDYKQNRDILAAGIANAEWSNIADYEAGTLIKGTDFVLYQAAISSGPSFGGPVNPVGDVTGAWYPFMLSAYPVGSVYLCMDAVSPAVKFGGTWSLLYEANTDIKLGDGSAQSGTSTGDNNPAVPLKDHTHTFSTTSDSDAHTHTYSGSTDNDTHSHGIPAQANNAGGAGYVEDADSSGTSHVTNTDEDTHNHTYSGTTDSDAHTHGVSGTTDLEGDGTTPTLDVSGKGLSINVWQRTA
jgi:hypothetical protein